LARKKFKDDLADLVSAKPPYFLSTRKYPPTAITMTPSATTTSHNGRLFDASCAVGVGVDVGVIVGAGVTVGVGVEVGVAVGVAVGVDVGVGVAWFIPLLPMLPLLPLLPDDVCELEFVTSRLTLTWSLFIVIVFCEV